MAERGKWDRRIWPPEIFEYVTKNASDTLTISGMKDEINRIFGTEYIYSQVKRFYYVNHLPHKRNTRHNILLTDEQAEYLISIIPGKRSDEIVRLLNEKFGLTLTTAQIRGWKKNHKVPSGYDARFRKGRESLLKGAKWDDFMPPESQEKSRTTCFKKGNRPSNKVPIGTITKRSGYMWIKVKDNNGTKNFKLYHRYVWEQANGPVPEGYRLFFLDGNPYNCSLENIRLVKDSVMVVANNKYGTTNDPEINRMILTAAELKVAVSAAERKGKGK